MDVIASIAILIGFAIGAAIYFLPSIVAFNRSHNARWGVFILNLLVGWTLIGWVASFIWAFAGAANRR